MYSFLYLDLASEKLRDLIVSTALSKIREPNNIRNEGRGPHLPRCQAPSLRMGCCWSLETFGRCVVAEGQVRLKEEPAPHQPGGQSFTRRRERCAQSVVYQPRSQDLCSAMPVPAPMDYALNIPPSLPDRLLFIRSISLFCLWLEDAGAPLDSGLKSLGFFVGELLGLTRKSRHKSQQFSAPALTCKLPSDLS